MDELEGSLHGDAMGKTYSSVMRERMRLFLKDGNRNAVVAHWEALCEHFAERTVADRVQRDLDMCQIYSLLAANKMKEALSITTRRLRSLRPMPDLRRSYCESLLR